jgi:hypothetical protein
MSRFFQWTVDDMLQCGFLQDEELLCELELYVKENVRVVLYAISARAFAHSFLFDETADATSVQLHYCTARRPGCS